MTRSAAIGLASTPPKQSGNINAKKSPLRSAAMVRSVNAPRASPAAASLLSRSNNECAFSRRVSAALADAKFPRVMPDAPAILLAANRRCGLLFRLDIRWRDPELRLQPRIDLARKGFDPQHRLLMIEEAGLPHQQNMAKTADVIVDFSDLFEDLVRRSRHHQTGLDGVLDGRAFAKMAERAHPAAHNV